MRLVLLGLRSPISSALMVEYHKSVTRYRRFQANFQHMKYYKFNSTMRSIYKG
jgi:hypothetical protein